MKNSFQILFPWICKDICTFMIKVADKCRKTHHINVQDYLRMVLVCPPRAAILLIPPCLVVCSIVKRKKNHKIQKRKKKICVHTVTMAKFMIISVFDIVNNKQNEH